MNSTEQAKQAVAMLAARPLQTGEDPMDKPVLRAPADVMAAVQDLSGKVRPDPDELEALVQEVVDTHDLTPELVNGMLVYGLTTLLESILSNPEITLLRADALPEPTGPVQ